MLKILFQKLKLNYIENHIDQIPLWKNLLLLLIMHLFHKILFTLASKRPKQNIEAYTDNSKQIFHAFLFNIINYSPEVINIQRLETQLNIILPRVNDFDIKQKKQGIFVLIYATNTKQDLGR